MPNSTVRNILTLSLLAAPLGSVACSSDQSRHPADQSAVPPAESPAETSRPQPGDAATPAPNGEPTTMPPSTPPAAAPQSRNDAATAPRIPEPAPEPAPKLSQNQVAMFADLANASEIEQGKLAQTKARSADVKKFATMMVKHHTEAKQEQAKLFQKLSLVPTQSAATTELKDGADRTLGSLRGADGSKFDVLYVDSQVEAHEKVLSGIDQQLLPAASDEALIEGLKKMRATVEAHLTEARALQAKLTKAQASRADAR